MGSGFRVAKMSVQKNYNNYKTVQNVFLIVFCIYFLNAAAVRDGVWWRLQACNESSIVIRIKTILNF